MSAFLHELLRAGIYKRSQGRICRQVTFVSMAIVIAFGLFQLSDAMKVYGKAWQFGLPSALLLTFWWITYRLVNLPAFADFLIAVEAEMNKVTWPSRHELFKGSAVVLIVIILLAGLLCVFDLFWIFIFTRVLHIF